MRVTAYGVDYDAVAQVYDEHPARRKNPDVELTEFLRERGGGGGAPVDVLDVGCGTGNQLVADLDLPGLPAGTRLVGLDPFDGMLRVARRKSSAIRWVRGDGTRLPFAGETFDFVTNQFSHHHIADVRALLSEVRRVLRPRGRFVLTNIAPRGMEDAQLYRWFPDAFRADLGAHPPPGDMALAARSAGFAAVEARVVRHEWETDLGTLAAAFARRRDDSRLNLLPDEAFERGLTALRAEAEHRKAETFHDAVALVTLTADVG
ncbi:MAG TPA: methyltransferase domain-containing protein [Chloroflexota bacterium]|nr:methyltransferase domain-containing protein [Chloroflexota bacterium]